MERLGIVLVYEPGGPKPTIIISGRDGDLSQFDLASPLKIVPHQRAGGLRVGSFVTIIAPANEPNNKHTGVGVVVHRGVPRCFKIPRGIEYNVRVDVTSTTDLVEGSLVPEGTGMASLDVTVENLRAFFGSSLPGPAV